MLDLVLVDAVQPSQIVPLQLVRSFHALLGRRERFRETNKFGHLFQDIFLQLVQLIATSLESGTLTFAAVGGSGRAGAGSATS